MAILGTDDDLADRIAANLRTTGTHAITLKRSDRHQLPRVRSAAQTAGRILGWRIQLIETAPDLRNAGAVTVIILALDLPPELRTRLRERARQLTRRALREVGNAPPPRGTRATS